MKDKQIQNPSDREFFNKPEVFEDKFKVGQAMQKDDSEDSDDRQIMSMTNSGLTGPMG